MKYFSAAFLFLIALAAPTSSSAVAPTLEHFFPAGGQRGKTVTVNATGKFSSRAIGAWCSRDGIKVTVTGKSSSSRSLAVKIPKETKPGVCWIRLHNSEGASSLRPFFVGTIAEVAEKEPNNQLFDSIPILSQPSTINGILAKSRDVDTFAIQLKKGQTLVVAMTANNTLGSPMDGILQVVSERGFILAQNDDHVGFDPRIAFAAPSDGKYFVRTFAFPAKPNSSVRFAGAANYIYRLTITAGPYVDYAYPLAVRQGATDPVRLHGWNLPAALKSLSPTASPDAKSILIESPLLANSTSIQRVAVDTFTEESWTATNGKRPGGIPAVVTGRLSEAGEVDDFQFRAKKGTRMKISVDSRALGFPTDPVLRVTDETGKTIKRVETRSSTAIDESLSLTIPKDGVYIAEVSDLHTRGGSRFVYRLSLLAEELSYQLSVKADVYTLTAGKPLTIPVTIARDRGYRGEIDINVAGLPKGVTAKPVKSLPKGATAKAVKLVLTANAKTVMPLNGSFRIVGTVKAAAGTKSATAAITGLTDKTADLWLTVVPAKKPVKPVKRKKK